MSEIDSVNTTDEVIREVWRIKERLAEAMDFDLHRTLEDARAKEQQSDRTVAPPPARTASGAE
ncbi:MAG: hypothetical protein ACOC46_01855 [Pirellulales bacterium]